MNWLALVLLSAVFASLTAVLAKIGIKNVDSNLATAIRTSVILVFTWGLVMYQGTFKGLGGMSKNSVLFLVLSGIMTGLSWLFYFRALQVGKISQVVPIDKMSLVITALLAVIFLKEKITLVSGVGMVLMELGAILTTM